MDALVVEIYDSELLLNSVQLNESQFNLPENCGAESGRPELPWDLKSPRSKDRSATVISDGRQITRSHPKFNEEVSEEKMQELVAILNRVYI